MIGMYIKVPVEKRWPRQTVTQGDFNKGTSGRNVGRGREIPRICYGGVVVAMATSEKPESELLGQQEGEGRAGGVGFSGGTRPAHREGPTRANTLTSLPALLRFSCWSSPGPNPTGSKRIY